MVVAPHPAAGRAGAAALAAGGSAVDAAVAANAALAVVYPSACGVGGDLFALVWSAEERRLYGLNASGRSPRRLTPELVEATGARSMPERGALTVTVPGAVDGWRLLVERFGRLPLAAALEPAALLAEEGQPLAPRLAPVLAAAFPALDAAGREAFGIGGRAPAAGEPIRLPALAAMLRRLAADGTDALYHGPIGASLASAVQAAGGVLSTDDLGQHRSDWVEPISVDHADVEIVTLPPNSQGITALIALRVLQALERRGWPGVPPRERLAAGAPLTAERVHVQAEALKVAWAERDRWVADPDRLPAPIDRLLSGGHADLLAARLDPARAGTFVPQQSSEGGTVYLAAADGEGNVVSLIQSIYDEFGSGVVDPRTGVVLHNRGSAFLLEPGHPNRLAPGVRTLHTLMPVMLLRDGRPWAALGTMGADGQPQTILQLLAALLDDGLEPQQAVERARFRLSVERRGEPLGPMELERDAGGRELAAGLEERGHRLQLLPPRSPRLGWAQVLRIGSGGFVGGADPRADSAAIGL